MSTTLWYIYIHFIQTQEFEEEKKFERGNMYYVIKLPVMKWIDWPDIRLRSYDTDWYWNLCSSINKKPIHHLNLELNKTQKHDAIPQLNLRQVVRCVSVVSCISVSIIPPFLRFGVAVPCCKACRSRTCAALRPWRWAIRFTWNNPKCFKMQALK